MIPHTGTPDTFGGNSKNSKFRTIPCWRFHLEGNCQFGLKCTFSHEPITPEQKEDLYKRFAHQTTRTSKSNEGDGTPVKASSSQEPPQTPFTPKASSKPSRINKSDFDTLIDVVNYHSHGTPNNAPLPRAALKSQVGADNRVQLAWRGRNLGSFREYVAAAEQLKLVQSWRPAGPGSDLIGVVKSKHARQQSGGILNLGALDLNPVWDSASEQEDEVVMEFE